jgi:hypothetical protein
MSFKKSIQIGNTTSNPITGPLVSNDELPEIGKGVPAAHQYRTIIPKQSQNSRNINGHAKDINKTAATST